MTAIEDRIAAVVGDHAYETWHSLYDCSCGAGFWDRPGIDAWSEHVAAAVVAELQPELGELEATKLLLAATREQLSRTITDFCAVRDALPRDQVEQILAAVDAGGDGG